MRNLLICLFLLCSGLIFISSLSICQNVDPERQWSHFRGHLSSGYHDKADLPESWNLGSNENVLWNIEIPGLGLSSPVIWGDNVFITTAISSLDNEGLKPGIYGSIGSVEDNSEHEWKVYCLDKNSGEISRIVKSTFPCYF